MVLLFEDLSYVDNVVPSNTAVKNQGKQYIETRLLVDVGSKEARKTIFEE